MVPVSMQNEVRSLLPVQNVRCVHTGQAVNAALGRGGHNEVPMTCMQLSVNVCALQGAQSQPCSFNWLRQLHFIPETGYRVLLLNLCMLSIHQKVGCSWLPGNTLPTEQNQYVVHIFKRDGSV